MARTSRQSSRVTARKIDEQGGLHRGPGSLPSVTAHQRGGARTAVFFLSAAENDFIFAMSYTLKSEITGSELLQGMRRELYVGPIVSLVESWFSWGKSQFLVALQDFYA